MSKTLSISSSLSDAQTSILETILDAMRKGTLPWRQPWGSGLRSGFQARPVRLDGTPYRGINAASLWCQQMRRGYDSGYWMTARQAELKGAELRPGERPTPVLFGYQVQVRRRNAAGEEWDDEAFRMRTGEVFNFHQVRGLPLAYHLDRELVAVHDRLRRAEEFMLLTGAKICRGSGGACYRTDTDWIEMPPAEQFNDRESYLSVLGHELIHWTEHPKRLNRTFARKRWGDEGYAKGELVAEFGSAFLDADLQISTFVRPDHASYIESWLQLIDDKPRVLFQSAAMAATAVDYLHDLQPVRLHPIAK